MQGVPTLQSYLRLCDSLLRVEQLGLAGELQPQFMLGYECIDLGWLWLRHLLPRNRWVCFQKKLQGTSQQLTV